MLPGCYCYSYAIDSAACYVGLFGYVFVDFVSKYVFFSLISSCDVAQENQVNRRLCFKIQNENSLSELMID